MLKPRVCQVYYCRLTSACRCSSLQLPTHLRGLLRFTHFDVHRDQRLACIAQHTRRRIDSQRDQRRQCRLEFTPGRGVSALLNEKLPQFDASSGGDGMPGRQRFRQTADAGPIGDFG